MSALCPRIENFAAICIDAGRNYLIGSVNKASARSLSRRAHILYRYIDKYYIRMLTLRYANLCSRVFVPAGSSRHQRKNSQRNSQLPAVPTVAKSPWSRISAGNEMWLADRTAKAARKAPVGHPPGISQ